MRKFVRISGAILAGFLVLGVCGVLLAQTTTTGILEGVVRDENGKPLSGAAITVNGPQGVRTAVTDDRGRFEFRDLVPGEYAVKAEASGFATIIQTEVLVVVGKRTQLPYVLTSGKIETITVTSEAPIVDLKSTTVGTTVSVEDLVDFVPLNRNFASMFTLSPGVVGGLAAGAGNYSISGSSGLENSYLIDGVNITNSGYGGIGSYNRVFGSLGSGVTNDFIDQVEVKEGGFEAEFGQATGGVINAIVKSGTNTFDGQFSTYLTPNSLESTRREYRRFPDSVTTDEEDESDLAVSFGGPLIKDRLFWYAAYNRIDRETTFRRTIQDLDALFFDPEGAPTCPDGQPPEPEGCPYDRNQLSEGRVETRDRSTDNYAGKISWFVTPNHRVEFTAFGDPSDGDLGAQRRSALTLPGTQGYSQLSYGGNNYSLKYFGAITSNLFIDAIYGYHESELIEDAQAIYRIDDLDVAGGLQTGGLGFSPDTDEEVDQYGVKVTWVIGDHELKVGWQRDEIDYIEAGRQTGPNWFANLPTAVIGTDGDWVWDGGIFQFESTTGAFVEESGGVHATQRSRFSPVEVLTGNEEENWFLQWTWSINPRVTLKAGLRRTEGFVAGGSPFTLPFTVVRRSAGNRNRMVDPTTPQVFDPTALTFPTETVPRLGVSWDILGDGRHKLYANYAEYVQRLTQDLAYRAFSNEVDIRQSWMDADLTVPDLSGSCPVDDGMGGTMNMPCQIITAATGLGGPTTVYKGTELPITLEFLVGYSREITPTMGVDFRYIHRELDRVIEDFSYVPQEAINNAIWGGGFGDYPYDPYPQYPAEFFGDYVLANPSDNSLAATVDQAPMAIADLYTSGVVSDFPEPKRNYDALEFVINKRMSNNWLLWGSYRWARLEGNYEGLLRNDNGQDDPNITSLYDFPDTPLLRGQFLNGRLNLDVEHNLKVFSNYQFPTGLSVGGAISWSSGTPRFPLLLHPNDFYQLAGNGETAGTDPVYGMWLDRFDVTTGDVALVGSGLPGCTDADADGACDPIFVLVNGIGGSPNQQAVVDPSTGMPIVGADGDLQFMDYVGPVPTVEYREAKVNPTSGLPQFLYSYTPVERTFNGRTPDLVNVDFHVAYTWDFGWRNSSLTLALDVFNIFDSQETFTFDDVLELEQGEFNPNFGRPGAEVYPFQGPRLVRFGLRYNF